MYRMAGSFIVTRGNVEPVGEMGLNMRILSLSGPHGHHYFAGGFAVMFVVVAYVLAPTGAAAQDDAIANALSTDSRLAAGGNHTCAMAKAGVVKCWGDNGSGEIGDGTRKDRLAPVQVKQLVAGSVIALAAGASQSCALTKAGVLKCWGDNTYGEVGDGTKTNRLTPVTITSHVAALSAGAAHTCALTEAGGLMCWGGNWAGQLGDGTAMNRLSPVNVTGLKGGIAAVAAGNFHTCALTDTGGVLCWGQNLGGQLGDGTRIERLTPVGVHGLSGGVIAIAAGGGQTCALTTAGGVKCWGGNPVGQLGDGTTKDRLTPVNVKGLTSGAIAIAAGEAHTCALTEAGGVKCWGFNEFGQLGNGSTTDQSTPAKVKGLTSGVIAISAGLEHTCALTKAGAVECWGDDSHGDLGLGSTIPRDAPVPVPGF